MMGENNQLIMQEVVNVHRRLRPTTPRISGLARRALLHAHARQECCRGSQFCEKMQKGTFHPKVPLRQCFGG